MGDLDDGALGIAVDQQVGLGINEDRAAHLVLPVVVVRDAAQARFDATDDHRYVAPGFLAALRVDEGRAVGPGATQATGRVGVVAAYLSIRRVAVDHRIHVAGGDAEEQLRFAHGHVRLYALPIGLRDDADTKALRLQHASDHRHAKARVVDVSVTGDDDDVATVPAERVHVGAIHRQKRRRAEALGPIRSIGRQRLEWTRLG